MNENLRTWLGAVLFVALVASALFNIILINTKNDLEEKVMHTQESVDILENENQKLTATIDGLNEELFDKYEEIASLQDKLSVTNERVEKMQEAGVPLYFTDEEVNTIAKTVWGEAQGLNKMEQSAVVWCILNYVDAGYGTIIEAITYPERFHGYNPGFPVTDEIKALVEDVIVRWRMEKLCDGDVGRTLPSEYLWFHGDGEHNYFRNSYDGEYDIWNWDCWNPYE